MPIDNSNPEEPIDCLQCYWCRTPNMVCNSGTFKYLQSKYGALMDIHGLHKKEFNNADQEKQLYIQLLTSKQETWPFRPRYTRYCGLYQHEKRYIFCERKNDTRRCEDFAPQDKRECNTCVHHRHPQGRKLPMEKEEDKAREDWIDKSDMYHRTGDWLSPERRREHERYGDQVYHAREKYKESEAATKKERVMFVSDEFDEVIMFGGTIQAPLEWCWCAKIEPSSPAHYAAAFVENYDNACPHWLSKES